MTVEVPSRAPLPPDEAVLEIADPMRAIHNGIWVEDVAHMLGHQMGHVHENAFGTSEATTATYRFLYPASPNAETLFFNFIPYGNVTGVGDRTIHVPGADEPTPRLVTQRVVDISDLSELNENVWFRLSVTPNSFSEVTYEVSDVRLHSVVVYEQIRRDEIDDLATVHNYLSPSFADPGAFVTDNGLVADPYGRTRRGMPTLAETLILARSSMRRCLTPFVNPGVTVNPAALDTWTDVPGFDHLFVRGRDVKGGATALTRMRFRCFIYVSQITAASTWQFRVATQDDARTSSASANITTTGWKPGTTGLSTGVEFDIDATTGEKVKLQVQQTVGGAADTLTINGFDRFEQAA